MVFGLTISDTSPSRPVKIRKTCRISVKCGVSQGIDHKDPTLTTDL